MGVPLQTSFSLKRADPVRPVVLTPDPLQALITSSAGSHEPVVTKPALKQSVSQPLRSKSRERSPSLFRSNTDDPVTMGRTLKSKAHQRDCWPNKTNLYGTSADVKLYHPLWERKPSSVFKREKDADQFTKVVFTPEYMVGFLNNKPTFWNLKDLLVVNRPAITSSSKKLVKKILQCNIKVEDWMKKAAKMHAAQQPIELPPIEWFDLDLKHNPKINWF